MTGPFPGMDPWLEDAGNWPAVHSRLLIYIADALQPLLGRRYVVGIEDRVYLAPGERLFVPDVDVRRSDQQTNWQGSPLSTAAIDEAVLVDVGEVETHERYLEIRDLATGEMVVTVIEIVSPSNKRSGTGRDRYVAKQREVLESTANLVEIDLLRGGPHVVIVPEEHARRVKDYDYLVSISRAVEGRSRFRIYPRTLRERLPRILIPLVADEPPVPLDLQAMVDRVYETGQYATRLRYSERCFPHLRPDDEEWARARIAAWQATAQS